MRSTKKIFLVDDEIGIIQSLKRELFPWAIENNFALATAQSGSEALEMVKGEPENVALVISDIKMPDMRGSDLLLEVNQLFPDIMTILLTGYAETEDMLKAIKAGIFSYILKPWDRFYLLSEVKKAIDIYTLKEENRRNVERMRDELRWAGELQRRILEVHPTETPKISFGIKYEPVGDLECGGDYYDVLHPSEDRYLLAIGDVSGHGVRAAFVTSILKTILSGDHVKAMITDDPDPGRLVTWLNTRIHDELHNLPDVVATFALCSLDLRSYRLRFACAGHLPAYLIRNDRIRAIHTDGPGLAFLRDVPYESVEVRLKRSDRIVLFSDGLYQTGADEPEQVRRGRTENTMLYAMNSDDFVSELVESSRSLAGDGRFEDDVTVVSAYLK